MLQFKHIEMFFILSNQSFIRKSKHNCLILMIFNIADNVIPIDKSAFFYPI